MIEAKQACYAATAAVQMAAGYVASGVSPGAKALVIATDVALVDERAGYAEPAMGTGAAAVLVSERPAVLAVDLGAFGNYSYETMDSARPAPTFDIADADGSLFAYLDCLEQLLPRTTAAGSTDVDFATTFDYLAMHTPFAGHGQGRAPQTDARVRPRRRRAPSSEDFERRVAPSLAYPRRVGNLCSGSVYLALAQPHRQRPARPRRPGRPVLLRLGLLVGVLQRRGRPWLGGRTRRDADRRPSGRPRV